MYYSYKYMLETFWEPPEAHRSCRQSVTAHLHIIDFSCLVSAYRQFFLHDLFTIACTLVQAQQPAARSSRGGSCLRQGALWESPPSATKCTCSSPRKPTHPAASSRHARTLYTVLLPCPCFTFNPKKPRCRAKNGHTRSCMPGCAAVPLPVSCQLGADQSSARMRSCPGILHPDQSS